VDPKTEHANARVGTWLRDKWRLDALLGLGGMAAVYSATHRNGKRAAVKMLHPQSAADPAVRARFLREGYLANQVGHPGAVSILDDDITDEGFVYLVMELLEGDTLEDLRIERGGTLALGDVLTVVDQALDVLVAAHDRKIVHRDIKPANLFVTLSGVVKVLDFGIARLDDSSTQRTATTTFSSAMGTIGFMAPEQARGRWELVDARTDLWSVGATMFELLTGRLVHQAATNNEMLLAAMTQPATPIAGCAPELHQSAARIVDRALAYEREDRWPDARSMQHAVRAAYLDLTGQALSPLPVPSLPNRIRRSGPPASPTAPTLPAVSGPDSTETTAPRLANRNRSNRRRAAGVLAVVLGSVATFGTIAAMRGDLPRTAGASNSPAASLPLPAERAEPLAFDAITAPSTEASIVTPGSPMSVTSAAPSSSSVSTFIASTTPHAAPTTRQRPPPRPAQAPAEPTSEAPTTNSTIDIFGRRK
jgi:serine/threonine protein kinase